MTVQQQAVSPGTAVLPTTAIDALFGVLYPTRSANLGIGLAYRWSDPVTVQGYWPSGTAMSVRFEARPVAPDVLAL